MHPKKTLKMTERQLQHNIMEILELAGITAWFTHKIGAYRHKPIIKGISDIIGIYGGGVIPRGDVIVQLESSYPVGIFLAIEVKLPGQVTTLDQDRFLDTVNMAGGIGFVAYSEQDVINKLNITNLRMT